MERAGIFGHAGTAVALLGDLRPYLPLLAALLVAALMLAYGRVKHRLPFAHGKAVEGKVEITPTLGHWLWAVLGVLAGLAMTAVGASVAILIPADRPMFLLLLLFGALTLAHAGLGARNLIDLRARQIRYDMEQISYTLRGRRRRRRRDLAEVRAVREPWLGRDQLRFDDDRLSIPADAGGYRQMRQRIREQAGL